MVDPKLGRQCMGVPLPTVAKSQTPNPKRASMSDSRDEPISGQLSTNELSLLLAHLQDVEERHRAAIAELRSEVDALSERASKLPSTPPGNIDITRGNLRVRGPAGYALAIVALISGALAAWQLLPTLLK